MFTNTGIRTRYSCVPIEWYDRAHGWAERNRIYLASALDLIEARRGSLLDRAGLGKEAIDAIVTVSSTGIATPSLDALLIERMGLRADAAPLADFRPRLRRRGDRPRPRGSVRGCRRIPGETVLLLVVELCALSFRRDDLSKSNIVATALFGDGAAAALLSTEGAGPAIAACGRAHLARHPRR